MKISRHWSFRTIGWAAAYVLALHTILASFMALPAMAAAGGDGALVLCLSGGEQSQPGGAPTHDQAPHCAICVFAGNAIPPTEAAPSAAAFLQGAGVLTLRSGPLPPCNLTARPGLPRAPPLLA